MNITDVSGYIYHGMWTYGGPYGEVQVVEIPPPEWLTHKTYSWRMSMSVQSGTYLETALHVRRDGPPLIDIPLEDLWMRDCVLLRVPKGPDEPISRTDLEACQAPIRKGDTIIVATGWDDHWRQSDFVQRCPWFLREAMDWILDHEPFMFCGDVPRFDSWETPQGFWPRFFDQGTLLLAPLVNLGAVQSTRAKICALPMKVEVVCAAPCRVVIVEE